MSEPQNIQLFNKIVLTVLTSAYEEFPNQVRFGSVDLAKKVAVGVLTEELGSRTRTELESTCMETIRWLGEEGFIRIKIDPVRSPWYVEDVRLTARGLAIMGLPIGLRQSGPTLFEQSKKALTDGAVKGIGDATKGILSAVFGAGVKLALEHFGVPGSGAGGGMTGI